MEYREPVQVHGAWTFIWTNAEGRERLRQDHNLVVNTGLYAIAAMLTGEIEQDCAVYLGMGTGTSAANSTDIKLETETIRKIVTTKTRSGATLIYRFYFLTSEAIGDYTEWGVFWEGTTALESGRLINRLVPVGGVSKDASENLTVEVKLTLAAA